MSSSQYLNRAKELVEHCEDTERIRNVCIIAHVDHGKTSLSDFLLASNKHISLRQIQGGQKTGEAVRFLDSRMDEIDRQITIKSSCISLTYQRNAEEAFLFNLIDSPGHIDFAAEVSAAARLTDGAVLVVDAVEGVRAQTCSVIRQAWENRIVPILLINKIDRLCELVSDTSEANNRIRQIVENANLLFNDLLEAYKEENELTCIPETLVKQYQFDPVAGNVLFGSALHGWAFGLSQWTDKLVRPKLEKHFASPLPTLLDYMYGEWTLSLSNKGSSGTPLFAPVGVSADQPTSMFTKFVIEQIWALYGSNADAARIKLGEMFPVAQSIFESLVTHAPSPAQAMIARQSVFSTGSLPHAPVVAPATASDTVLFVVKHHPADLNLKILLGDRVDDVRQLTGFVGVSRVFSGCLETGQSLSVCKDPAEYSGEAPETVQATVRQIFVLMGVSLIPVVRAVSGSVVAIEFDTELTDSGGVTLSSNPSTPAMLSPYKSAQAIVRVTAEVKKSADEAKLDLGLRLLARSDPAVLVTRHPQTGERIIGCCGDEHLARCMQDLERLFAVGTSITISPPIVEIRESMGAKWNGDIDDNGAGGHVGSGLPAWLSEFAPNVDRKSASGSATCKSPDGSCSITVSARQIPQEAMEWIAKWKAELITVFLERRVPLHLWAHFEAGHHVSLDVCVASVRAIFRDSFGIPNIADIHVKSEAFNILCSEHELTDTVKFGFQQACLSGPLADEPVRGVVWSVLDCQMDADHPSSISYATSQACRCAMLAGPVRISEPMLTLELQTEHVRAAQAVLSQRRADITYSDLVEGSYSEYLIKATIPASDTFNIGEKSKQTFSDELRGATHGKVVWRMYFSHWHVLEDSSPLGPNGVAHRLVCGVRKRKGLSIGEKVVADADKQRTLTKMK